MPAKKAYTHSAHVWCEQDQSNRPRDLCRSLNVNPLSIRARAQHDEHATRRYENDGIKEALTKTRAFPAKLSKRVNVTVCSTRPQKLAQCQEGYTKRVILAGLSCACSGLYIRQSSQNDHAQSRWRCIKAPNGRTQSMAEVIPSP